MIFAVVGRIMKDKGTDEVLYAAHKLRETRPDVRFRLIGFYDEDYREAVDRAVERGDVEFCGNQEDVRPFFRECSAAIVASYHEGMSNVLLEAASTGRPVLATDVPGCRETFVPGVSGIAFKPADPDDLVRAIEDFLSLPREKRAGMGREGRKLMEERFDRRIVVEAYLNQIGRLIDRTE